MKKAISIFLVVILTLSITAVALAADRPEANYIQMEQAGKKVFMGTLAPGNYVISTSASPKAVDNVLKGAGAICNIANFLGVGALMPGCSFKTVGDWIIKYTPNEQYQVWLNDAKTGKQAWTGYLNSGETLYLGNDHTKYEVYFAATNAGGFTQHVSLIPNN